MSGIWVVVEHRQGAVREISYELLGKGKVLAEALDTELQAVVLSGDGASLADTIKPYAAKVLSVEDPQLAHYNGLTYCAVLESLFKEQKPQVVLMGHSACGMELAPRLSAALRWPLASDCVDVAAVDGGIEAMGVLVGLPSGFGVVDGVADICSVISTSLVCNEAVRSTVAVIERLLTNSSPVNTMGVFVLVKVALAANGVRVDVP